MSKLIVVSNRLPTSHARPGGLAVALGDALASHDCLWAGWSGEISDRRAISAREDDATEFLEMALSEAEHEAFYLNASNSVLWPTLHYRVDLAAHHSDDAALYRQVNKRYAAMTAEHVAPGDIIWAHDYHLFMLAEELRSFGVTAPIGLFLHIPFPPPEIFATIPWHVEIARGLAEFDLVGFQTQTDLDNFQRSMAAVCDAVIDGDDIVTSGRRTRTGAFPISIDADEFAALARSPAAQNAARLLKLDDNGALVLGVDRMDYSKGIPERLLAIEKYLADHSDAHGTVQFLQVAPPSRSTIGAYADLGAEVDGLIGRINGAHARIDWTPVHYLAQMIERDVLAGIHRHARAALVTPLRDGMNLVAKEFVAAQNPADPGVLILSRFAGAAAEFTDALLVNPHDVDEVAGAIDRALTMPLAERIARHSALLAALHDRDARRWSRDFIASLKDASRQEAPPPPRPKALSPVRLVSGG